MSAHTVLKPGANCWKVAPADRVSFLVDGADYFNAFREVAKMARHSIFIIGWDMDSRFRLVREDPADHHPVRLGDFLNDLLRRRKHLRIHVLNWDFPVIYAPDREFLPLYKPDWTSHRRLHYRMDSAHPPGASHHQKIVVVDDFIAFVGGLDFTFGRWDTPEHRPDDTRRRDTDGPIPAPYHDVQLMVCGKVSRALGRLARARWRAATRHRPMVPGRYTGKASWPDGIAVDIEDVEVGIMRTYPEFAGQKPVREVERFIVDAIHSARDYIYIENQYFTANTILKALESRLSEADGPEIVVILPEKTIGWLSQLTMDVLRERALKRLISSDPNHRLRVYHPVVPGLDDRCINVHSKLMVIDNRLVLIGSANFNNRSMGLDTECDLAIEAGDETSVSRAVAGLRNRLLAEHLGTTPDAVKSAVNKRKSLIRAIDSLNGSDRMLRKLPLTMYEQVDGLVPNAELTDPEHPLDGEFIGSQLIPADERPPVRRVYIKLAAILVVLLALAAGWRWLPLTEWINVDLISSELARLRGSWLAPVIVAAVYVIGGLIVFPLTLLILATGAAFGTIYGFVYALLGTLLSACFTFIIGKLLGGSLLPRLSHRWVERVRRKLARQGLLAIITVRIVPIAPFSVINLIAGASRIKFRDFTLGTLLGLIPGVLALTALSDQITQAILSPSTARIALLIVLALVIGIGAYISIRWLMKKAPSSRPATDGSRISQSGLSDHSPVD